jgi:hypothetical protein
MPGFKLDQTFFGYKPQDRIALHENIFNLIWHGEGRWDWDTIYHMPIPIRAMWTKRVNDIIAMKIKNNKPNTPTPSKKPGK